MKQSLPFEWLILIINKTTSCLTTTPRTPEGRTSQSQVDGFTPTSNSFMEVNNMANTRSRNVGLKWVNEMFHQHHWHNSNNIVYEECLEVFTHYCGIKMGDWVMTESHNYSIKQITRDFTVVAHLSGKVCSFNCWDTLFIRSPSPHSSNSGQWRETKEPHTDSVRICKRPLDPLI